LVFRIAQTPIPVIRAKKTAKNTIPMIFMVEY
jgi:hypothetical protein